LYKRNRVSLSSSPLMFLFGEKSQEPSTWVCNFSTRITSPPPNSSIFSDWHASLHLSRLVTRVSLSLRDSIVHSQARWREIFGSDTFLKSCILRVLSTAQRQQCLTWREWEKLYSRQRQRYHEWWRECSRSNLLASSLRRAHRQCRVHRNDATLSLRLLLLRVCFVSVWCHGSLYKWTSLDSV
jgi:hypothetical protein